MTGFHALESGRWRWMARRGVALLKSPAERETAAGGVRNSGRLARAAGGVAAGRAAVAARSYARPGSYTLESEPVRAAGAGATVEIVADNSFSVAGDRRELSIIVTGVGFR